MRKAIFISLTIIAAGFLLIQLLPYGRNHTQPPVIREPAWDSLETKELAERACYDCHSNQTVWPWYSHVAPVSWMVQHHVDEGRQYLNFSEWGSGHRDGEEGEEMAEVVYEGEMPLASYLITHPQARLSNIEKAALARGLMAVGGGDAEHKGQQVETEETDEHEEGETYEDD